MHHARVLTDYLLVDMIWGPTTTFKSYVAVVGTDMLAQTFSAIGLVRFVPACRLLTRQTAQKAAPAPTNARV